MAGLIKTEADISRILFVEFLSSSSFA